MAESQCDNCKQVLEKKNFSLPMSKAYDGLVKESKTPIWTFSGLGVLFVLIIAGVVVGKQNEEKNLQCVTAPMSGDVYKIKIESNKYTLYKVDKIAGDSVYLRVNQYETNKISGLSDLKKKGDEGYSDEIIPVAKGKLITMLDEGEIVSVDRE